MIPSGVWPIFHVGGGEPERCLTPQRFDFVQVLRCHIYGQCGQGTRQK